MGRPATKVRATSPSSPAALCRPGISRPATHTHYHRTWRISKAGCGSQKSPPPSVRGSRSGCAAGLNRLRPSPVYSGTHGLGNWDAKKSSAPVFRRSARRHPAVGRLPSTRPPPSLVWNEERGFPGIVWGGRRHRLPWSPVAGDAPRVPWTAVLSAGSPWTAGAAGDRTRTPART